MIKMKYRTWKKHYYIKSSNQCAFPIPMGMGTIGISKWIHWYRHHKEGTKMKKIRWFLIKHYIRTYSERRKCHICDKKLKRKERIVFWNDGLHCSLCIDCDNSDWDI